MDRHRRLDPPSAQQKRPLLKLPNHALEQKANIRSSFGDPIGRGIDHRPVIANRVRKSIGAENTFSRDLTSLDDMRAELDPLVDKVWHYCESSGVRDER